MYYGILGHARNGHILPVEVDMKYKVFVPVQDSDKIIEMVIWCYNNICKNNLIWDYSYADDSDLNSDVNFYFRKESDATFFSLRWL